MKLILLVVFFSALCTPAQCNCPDSNNCQLVVNFPYLYHEHTLCNCYVGHLESYTTDAPCNAFLGTSH